MRVRHHLVAATALLSVSPVAAAVPMSQRMALSIMSRGQGIMTEDGGVSALLQAGIVQKSFNALLGVYPDASTSASFGAYVRRSAASVEPFVLNASYDATEYPLDRLSNGNELLALSAAAANSTASTGAAAVAVAALRESIYDQPRTAQGGLWYYTYPDWSYLDGMYSLGPFYALEAAVATAYNTSALDDMLLQFELLWEHTRNASSGLLVHGYDDSKTAVWADPVTGASPHVWDRSLGWFSMALVDTLEILSENRLGQPQHKQQQRRRRRRALLDMFQALMPAVMDAVDEETGGWWQVMDAPGRAGNYIESSGSAMFAYALLKGVRLGYLPDLPAAGEGIEPLASRASRASHVATRAHRYLTDRFVTAQRNGTLDYDGTVAVCSLNSNATYAYYVGQPILYNSVLGSGAYVLASLEVERLSGSD
ncbi:glycoside hydrolase family 105 protein [Xylariaceae sp. FL0804]|nr:glycoside hydrolase family 105 protein [Xylariaceae sp. FL0804]